MNATSIITKCCWLLDTALFAHYTLIWPKDMTAVKLCVLLIYLSTIGTLFAAPEAPCEDSKKSATLVVIDRTQPVTPLALKVAPCEQVIVQVHKKSPFEKISFTTRYAETPDEQAASIEKLFRLLSKFALSVPLTPSAIPIPPGFEIHSVQPAQIPLMIALEQEQQRLDKILKGHENEVSKSLTALNLFLRDTHGEKGDADNFKAALDMRLKDADALGKIELPSGAGSRLLHSKIFDPTGPLPAGPQGDKRSLGEVLDILDGRQKQLEARLADLEEARKLAKSLAAMFKSLQSEEQKKKWFVAEEPFKQPANRRASIEITAISLRSGEKEKLTALDITWAPEPKFYLSLGLAMSWVAKQEFANETLRDPAILLTDTVRNPFTYRIGGTQTKPLILPMTLIHIPIKDRRGSRYGFAFTGGAGVNLAGDSPTGELALGGSLRIGNAFVSPLLHFGRQRRLADGFNLHEPTPEKFVPPTVTGWKPGFALAITYRLPL